MPHLANTLVDGGEHFRVKLFGKLVLAEPALQLSGEVIDRIQLDLELLEGLGLLVRVLDFLNLGSLLLELFQP